MNARVGMIALLVASVAAPLTAAGKDLRVTLAAPMDELRREVQAATPPHENGPFLGPELVDVSALDPTIRLDIRYATADNLMGAPLYTEARAFLQRPAAEALVRANARLRALGYDLIVRDAYRPWFVTKLLWDGIPGIPEWKRVYLADPRKGSRHNRGCAVDVTLFELASGDEVRMPSDVDEMSSRARVTYAGGTAEERRHRDLLRQTMEAEGFRVYPGEWWHFDYRSAGRYPILNLPFEAIGVTER